MATNIQISILKENGTYENLYPQTLGSLVSGIVSNSNKLGGYTYADLLLEVTKLSFPSGMIVLWSGSQTNIPTGWVLCNGSNGTPDLRNKFVIGAGSSYSVGNTGGETVVSLSTSNLPSHNHSASTTTKINTSGTPTISSAGGHIHTINGYTSVVETSYGTSVPQVNVASNNPRSSTSMTTAGEHTHTISGLSFSATSTTSISSTGSGIAHNNMPPYYALCYIMKT